MREVWIGVWIHGLLTLETVQFIGYPKTSNFVRNTPLRVVFSTLSSVFGYPDETLFLVCDILLEEYEFLSCSTNIPRGLSAYKPLKLGIYCLSIPFVSVACLFCIKQLNYEFEISIA